MKKVHIVSVFLLVVFLIIISATLVFLDSNPVDTERNTQQPSASSISSEALEPSVTLYFGDADVIALSDCSAVLPTERVVQSNNNTIDATMRLLFTGVTADEQSRGLTDSFTGKTSVQTGQPITLLETYQGITIQNGIATVDFSEEGLLYINAEACWQASVKASIEQTLLQFSEINSVQYSINGEVFTQWDA